MARNILNDSERFEETYWKKYAKQGWYHPGDAARRDADGYYWVIGRTDDVIKVSGYRLGSAEIESAMIMHRAVAESAAIALPHALKGNGIHCYVVLRQGNEPSLALEKELRDHIAETMGPIARPEEVVFVESLPKTRSGKIMRRVIKAKALGQDVGDLSTLDD